MPVSYYNLRQEKSLCLAITFLIHLLKNVNANTSWPIGCRLLPIMRRHLRYTAY